MPFEQIKNDERPTTLLIFHRLFNEEDEEDTFSAASYIRPLLFVNLKKTTINLRR